MLITALEPYKSRYCVIKLDDRRRLLSSQEEVARRGLCVGDQLTQDEAREIVFETKKARAWEQSLRYLDYRSHSYYELFTKLNKDFDEEICYGTLSRLVSLGMINDREYAAQLARKLVEVKSLGMHRVRSEMKYKGLDKNIIDDALREYEDDSDERLRRLVGRRYARKLCEENGVRKVTNALIRQGYGYAEIKAVLSEWDDDEEYCE